MTIVSRLRPLFTLATHRDDNRLRRALKDVRASEGALVASLVSDLNDTERGRRFGVTDARSFFANVPIVTYAELKTDIETQMRTGASVVVKAPVSLYEKTSGSSGAQKYIPYTSALRTTFARMFRAWAHDVVRHGPPLQTGKFYFSISPSFDDEIETESGERIGIDDDRGYLDGVLRVALAPFFVAPKNISREQNPERFKDETCLALLATVDLELVSVWSPTFFLVLLDHIRTHRVRLLDELAARASSTKNTRRVDALREIFRDDDVAFSAVWPSLKFISAWRGAHAATSFSTLSRAFPNALCQGKGLLATESPVTIPRIGDDDAHGVPLVADVLIEVHGDDGVTTRLSAAPDGHEGELVVSPRGGFTRYRLGDRVRVIHVDDGSPRLVFLGRQDRVSDLVGEKLEETFVDGVTAALFPTARFRTLVPDATRARYVLFVDEGAADATTGAAVGGALDAALDAALMRAFHYAHARKLGQLDAARVVVTKDAADHVLASWEASGRRRGDLKPSALITVPLSVTHRQLTDD